MNNGTRSSRQRMQAHPAAVIGPVVALLIALYVPTFVQLWHFWETDENFGHGFLVPLVSLYLVWRARDRLKRIPVEPHAPPIPWLISGLLLYVVGFRGAILSASAVSFVLVLTWFLWFFLGGAFVREIRFALFFLVFMIPIPMLDQLSNPLKLLASQVATPAVRALGVPIYREGAVLFLPHFSLEVATACSGLKALVLVTALGTLYGHLTLNGLWERLALIISCIPIAFAANIGRIVIVALLSLRVSGEQLLHLVHDYSGLPVYVIAGVLLAVTGWGIEWLSRRKRMSSSSRRLV